MIRPNLFDLVVFLLRPLLLFPAFLLLSSSALSEPVKSNPPVLNRIEQGFGDIQDARKSLAHVMAFMEARSDLFPRSGTKEQPMLTRDQRMAVWQTWQGFLDAMLSLDLIGQKVEVLADRGISVPKEQVFFASYAVFLTEYRYALDFIQIAERIPDCHILLNQAVPELGIDGGVYSDLKFRFLNVGRASKFAWMDMEYRSCAQSVPQPLARMIEEDRAAIWEAGTGTGPLLTLKNAFQVAKDSGYEAWFPFQAQLARWMGHTKVWRQGRSLITQAQIRAVWPLLRPGDVLLTRREWFLSNVGLPGFWPHALLYVGTPWERKRFFGDDMRVTVYVKMQGVANGDFEVLLQDRFPAAYKESNAEDHEFRAFRIIEATSDGVCFSSLEKAAAADSLAVLRPLLPRVAVARAILRAFQYSGRPYDFDFDFLTDSHLVCTELVTKCYEPEESIVGLDLPLREILGRKLITANDIVQLFDEEYETGSPQLEFIVFLDGNEADGVAYRSDVETFRTSWKRPKWHILLSNNSPSRAR